MRKVYVCVYVSTHMCVWGKGSEAENKVFSPALHPCFVSCHINQPISLMASEKLISSVYQRCCVFAGVGVDKALRHSLEEFILIVRNSG